MILINQYGEAVVVIFQKSLVVGLAFLSELKQQKHLTFRNYITLEFDKNHNNFKLQHRLY